MEFEKAIDRDNGKTLAQRVIDLEAKVVALEKKLILNAPLKRCRIEDAVPMVNGVPDGHRSACAGVLGAPAILDGQP